MTVQHLIEKLKTFPPDAPVLMHDWRKNLGADDGDGSSEGIYSVEEIELMKLEGDEKKYYEERNDHKWNDWIALHFKNEDYNDDGQLIAAT